MPLIFADVDTIGFPNFLMTSLQNLSFVNLIPADPSFPKIFYLKFLLEDKLL